MARLVGWEPRLGESCVSKLQAPVRSTDFVLPSLSAFLQIAQRDFSVPFGPL